VVIVVRPQRNIVPPWSRGQTGPAVSSGRVNAKQLGQDRGWHVGSQLVKGGESVWAGAHAMALQPPAQGLRTNGLIWIGADEEPSAVDNRLCLSRDSAGLLKQVTRHVTEGIGELDADSSQPPQRIAPPNDPDTPIVAASAPRQFLPFLSMTCCVVRAAAPDGPHRTRLSRRALRVVSRCGHHEYGDMTRVQHAMTDATKEH
jgi:hypothetical protein